MVATQHATHTDHDHQHGPGCGHVAVPHDDHVDYIHDGHRHAFHDGHWDDH
ncbi:zinc transporter permease [Corynebacterium bovis]|uniref:zinc transporter permease n=1 Tax=Corynebacterium bovis TaxID=36808 RepID=UPI00264F79D6|nr:zinc transporter permease [Corynebacterium bovis]MDN8578861.1 zinc transporter permease [Corynebacterium bovis]